MYRTDKGREYQLLVLWKHLACVLARTLYFLDRSSGLRQWAGPSARGSGAGGNETRPIGEYDLAAPSLSKASSFQLNQISSGSTSFSLVIASP
eukprot:2528692-Pyramimonas_sp.AAC.1